MSDMTFPLDVLKEAPQLGWLVSLLVGFGFGYVLERAGFGRSTKLAAQFYLTDLTVLKVMFSAIVTAGLGLVLFHGVGLVDAEAIAREAASTTLVWPMVLGGLLLGVGFVVSGYCPGTSMVATASGNVDGLVALVGVIAGGVVYGEVYPFIADFARSGDLGQTYLPDVLGLPRAVVMGLVVVMALGMFLGGEAVERWMSRRRTGEVPARRGPGFGARRSVFAGLAGAAALGILPLGAAAPERESFRHPELVHAEALAHRLTETPWEVRVLDLRPREAWAEGRIPGSEAAPLDELGNLALGYVRDRRDLVLVPGEGTLTHVPEDAAGYGGRVLTLDGGFEAWRTYALETPPPPASPMERAAFAFQSALQGYLTGRQAQAPPPAPTRAVTVRRSGGGGCN